MINLVVISLFIKKVTLRLYNFVITIVRLNYTRIILNFKSKETFLGILLLKYTYLGDFDAEKFNLGNFKLSFNIHFIAILF